MTHLRANIAGIILCALAVSSCCERAPAHGQAYIDGFKDGIELIFANQESLSSHEGNVCVPLATGGVSPVLPYDVGFRDGCDFLEVRLRKASAVKAEQRLKDNSRQSDILQRIAEIAAKYDDGEKLFRDLTSVLFSH